MRHRAKVKKAVSAPNATVLYKRGYMMKAGNDNKEPDIVIAAGNTVVVVKMFGTYGKYNTIRVRAQHQIEIIKPKKKGKEENLNAVILRYKAAELRVKLDGIIREKHNDVKVVSASLYTPCGAAGVMKLTPEDRSYPRDGEEMYGSKIFISSDEIAKYIKSISEKPSVLSRDIEERLVAALKQI